MTPPGASPRLPWADVAKAVAILLVVGYHTSGWFAHAVHPDTGGWGSVWWAISVALVPVRMPLFFLVSGILATRAITRPWAVLARTRFADLLWPFAIWTALIAVPWSLRVSPENPGSQAWTAASALVYGGAHYWYLPALVMFIALAKLVRRAPIVAVAIAASAAVIAPVLGPLFNGLGPILGANLDRWLSLCVWFLIGCFLRPVIERIAALPAVLGVGLLVAFGVTAAILPPRWDAPGIGVLIGAVGIFGVVIVSHWSSRSERIRRAGRFLAERTLPIYVGHALLLELLAVLAELLRARGIALPSGSTLIDALLVPVVAGAVVAASIGMFEFARRFGLGWIYEPPGRVRTDRPLADPT